MSSPLSIAALVVGQAAATSASPLDLPAEVRLAVLTRPADGDAQAALERCLRRDFHLEAPPDRFPHRAPAGPHWVDLGFLAPTDFDEPFRGLFATPGGPSCVRVDLPSGPVVLMQMMSGPPTPATPAAVAAWDEHRAAEAARQALRAERIPAEIDARRGAAVAPVAPPARVAAFLPGGVAWLGSTPEDLDLRVRLFTRYVAAHVGPAQRERYEDEVRRPVQLEAFALDTREVTVAAFRAFAAATGHGADPRSLDPALDGELPVTFVDAADASAYCAWAGGRLPEADEWELAARGAAGRRYPWGDEPPDGTRADFCDRSCPRPWATPDHDDGHAGLAPVGAYPAGATPEGLLDMGGNAREWTATPADGERLLVRGGGCFNAYDDLTAADVRANAWRERQPDLGFRCAYGGR